MAAFNQIDWTMKPGSPSNTPENNSGIGKKHMNISSIDPGPTLKPLKFALLDMPHATVEPNRTCNLRCRSCYNLDRRFEKPLCLVKEEIDLLIQKRNLQVITILGGEPTLYPKTSPA